MEEDLLNSLAVDTILSALTDPKMIEINNDAIHPAYDPHSLTQQEESYISKLRSKIQQESENAPEHVEPIGRLSVNKISSHIKVFSALLESIKQNNEETFLSKMMALVNSFDHNHSEARVGFIDAFTTLFVTKQFPSVGMRQRYFHFVLRCGGIY